MSYNQMSEDGSLSLLPAYVTSNLSSPSSPEWFEDTYATRSLCDERARDRLRGTVAHVNPLRQKSYDVTCGRDDKWLVMFRKEPSKTRAEVVAWAKNVYQVYAPITVKTGIIGYKHGPKTTLHVYAHSRFEGMTYSDAQIVHDGDGDDDSDQARIRRKNFITDLAYFFTLAWRTPMAASQEWKDRLAIKYLGELRLLKATLPRRFRPAIIECMENMKAIMSLPMTFNHCDLRLKDILVDLHSGRMTGVINWAMSETGPFGINLFAIEKFFGYHRYPDSSFVRHKDYKKAKEIFWGIFVDFTTDMDDATAFAVHHCRIMGLLLHYGFEQPSRVDYGPKKPLPLERDHPDYSWKMRILDTFLLDAGTSFDDLLSDPNPLSEGDYSTEGSDNEQQSPTSPSDEDEGFSEPDTDEYVDDADDEGGYVPIPGPNNVVLHSSE